MSEVLHGLITGLGWFLFVKYPKEYMSLDGNLYSKTFENCTDLYVICLLVVTLDIKKQTNSSFQQEKEKYAEHQNHTI